MHTATRTRPAAFPLATETYRNPLTGSRNALSYYPGPGRTHVVVCDQMGGEGDLPEVWRCDTRAEARELWACLRVRLAHMGYERE